MPVGGHAGIAQHIFQQGARGEVARRGGSAAAVAKAGAAAIASSSWAVAAALGETDGERLAPETVLDCVRRMVRACPGLPVTADIEAGYSRDAAGVGDMVKALLAAGAVGCNLEDGLPGDGTIRDPIQQAGRLRVARAAADAFGVSLFINARTDLFLRSKAEAHAGLVDDALERARLYADAGADSLFVPGLADPGLIARVAAESPLPVNVMVGAGPVDKAALARAGVARISYGPAPWLMAMQALEDLARAAL